MNPLTHVVCFAVRQACGVAIDSVAGAVEGYYRDHTDALPRAVQRATDRAWKALGVAIAGDGWLDRVRLTLTASGDEKAFREQVRKFLAAGGIAFEGPAGDQFRRDCLAELQQLLRDKSLAAGPRDASEVARGAADFRRFDRPDELVTEASRAAGLVADGLPPRFANLARLLRRPPPLLVTAFTYFFRREVLADEELRETLHLDGLRALVEGQQAGFQGLGRALDGLGERFEAAIDAAVADLAERIEATRRAAEAAEREARLAAAQAATAAAAAAGAEGAAREAHAAVLGLGEELRLLEGSNTAHLVELRGLITDVVARLDRHGRRAGELRPQDSLSIRGEDERRVVRQLLARLRQLPEADRTRLPALLNGLGKLQVAAGDYADARRTFADAASAAGDDRARAELAFNTYRAALEERAYDDALAALRQAARLDPARFSPFPLRRFVPERILGAGGFGAVFLCRDANFRDRRVAVKALYPAGPGAGSDDAFAEAHALTDLHHPAVIKVFDCDYADGERRERPFIVMPFFDGESLASFIQSHGPVPPADFLPLARLVAEGMAAAHDRGVLHRDLKPDNVLVRHDGGRWEARLIDFGLAARHGAGRPADTPGPGGGRTLLGRTVAGTLRYAPPEQLGEAQGVEVGPYSDVYAFGRLCYAVLLGDPQPDDHERDRLPAELRRLLSECTSRDYRRRPPHFHAVLARLADLTPPDEPVTVEPVRFTVTLVDVVTARKLIVIQVLRKFTGLGLAAAKEATETTPLPVLEGVDRATAEAARRELTAAGAEVDVTAEEAVLYDIVFEGYAPPRKLTVIKAVRELTGWGLAETVNFVEQAPAYFRRSVDADVVESDRAALEAAGAAVSVHAADEAEVPSPEGEADF